MLLLPIVDRELRVAARSSRTYWIRGLTGLGALGVALYLTWFARYAIGGGMAGIFILRSISYMVWALCVFAGVNRTCDSLSAEKRGDTLGLLFLTHLKGYDVVLGKLLASSMTAFFLLIGMVPILSVPVMLGGVSGAEMVRIPVALLNSLFLALAIGLFISSIVRSQQAAISLAGGVLAFFAVFLRLIAELVERQLHAPEVALLLRLPSPLYAQEMSFITAVGLSNNFFWVAVFVQFVIAVAALIGACVITPHSWKIKTAKATSWRERLNTWIHGTVAARTRRRTRLLGKNPFYWLIHRDRFAALWPVLLVTVIVGSTFWCIVHYEIPKPPACSLLFGALAVGDLMNRMRVARVGATRLAEDRHSGALELILSTRLSVKDIVKGQWKALRRIHLASYAFVFVVYLFVSVALLYDSPDPETPAFCAVILFFVIVSIGDFIVLGYVAMWKGVSVSNPRHAAGAAMVRVLIVPWFLWFGTLPLIHEVLGVGRQFNDAAPYSYLFLGLGIWALSSGSALISARRNIKRHFRQAATDRSTFEQRRRAWTGRVRAKARFLAQSSSIIPAPGKGLRDFGEAA